MPINASQTAIYESYSMIHPDGTLMCHCDEKKAKWYVKKNLAKWIDEKQFKLIFEPHGYGKSDNPYYTQKIPNQCVVCGEEEELNKHHVVPYVFRSRLPVEYKASNHHDILATCIDCHEKYELHANILKKQLADELGISVNNEASKELVENRKIKSAQKLLDKITHGLLVNDNGEKIIIPEQKLKALQEKAKKPLLWDGETSGAVWADKIIEKVLEEDKLFDFVKKWREHFLLHTNPQYLPLHWSVEHPLEIANQSKRKSKI